MCVYGNVGQDNVRLFTWFFFCEVLVRMADCALLSDGGSRLSKYTVLQRKDLTLKFLQTTVARICHCLIFFVVAYSYSKCKVLYESCLISSHIFIPDPPTYLTPPLPAVGKTSPGQDVEDLGNYLEDGEGRRGKKRFKSNLNTFPSRGDQSPNVFVLC